MKILEFLHEYHDWKKTHKNEVQQAALRKEMLKTPLNYTLLQNYLEAFFNQNRRDAILEITGNGYTIKVSYDDDGKTHLSNTEQILLSH